ncbi:hypothetical protein BRADI_2g27782v3 [Brachypodium distachyon]|uniref:Uncharacterized protein n=1 Tax=Brachypodium distachyon TaxID=15368 RepID=A0A0Q3J1V5_BRADI|nr:hypothetical protein BRADI_2g27782v3 [Brachypodium distachyon]
MLLLFPLSLFVLHYVLTAKTRRIKQQQQQQQQQQGNNSVDVRPPPSPPALPIIGHLHLMGSLPHVWLGSLARKYGPDVMLLRLGTVPTLVVSSPRAAEAVLRTHDHVFASRPSTVVADIIMYGSSDIAFAPYGEYWRQARKLVATHLLSAKKVQSSRGAAADEVSMVMSKISETAAADRAVDMSELLYTFANDMACRLVSGKFFQQEGRSKIFRDLIGDSSQLLGGFNMEEYFPALSRVGLLRRAVCAKVERVRNRWADLLDKVIDDHMNKDKSMFDQKDGDFVDTLLSVQHEYDLTREHMKALLTDMFFGATDTSSQTLEYTLAELMRRPHLMRKLQAEVRSAVPQGREIINEVDLSNMAYLSAVIKETLRLHPLALFLLRITPWTTATSTDIWSLLGHVSLSMYGQLVGTLKPGRMRKSTCLKGL